MTVVLDASLTLRWFFEDEQNPHVLAVLERVADTGAVVPSLWPIEVANGLQTAIRRGRIDTAFRGRALEQLGLLPIRIDGETNLQAWRGALSVADRFGLSVYHACYLELAVRLGLALASSDVRLCEAARGAGIEVFAG